MSTVVILAVIIVAVVAITAAIVVWRIPGRGAVDSGAVGQSETVTKARVAEPRVTPDRKRTKRDKRAGAGPSDQEIARLVAEAEEILRAGTKPAEGPVEVGRRRPTFRERLSRTRQAFDGRLAEIRLQRKVDDDVWEALEEALILADVGHDAAVDLVEAARQRAAASKAESPDEVLASLKAVMASRFSGRDRTLARGSDGTSVWLFVGVNGTGKTTTIGKVATQRSKDGETIVIAAADTFRAAAADQLEIWARRADAELVRGQEGADPGSVVFDAVSLARARHCDLLLVDTAGRLHTKVNLMEELKKICRTAVKAGGEPSEVLLVLDATTGQNGLSQARQFAEAAGVTGVVLTKLDGTAKGGIVFAIEQEFDIPIKLVGLGEDADDLVAFDADEFVSALFA